MDWDDFSDEEIINIRQEKWDNFSDEKILYLSAHRSEWDKSYQQKVVPSATTIPQPEEQGVLGSFVGGIGKTLLGAGETVGIVDPETYANYAEGFRQDEIQNPIASGLGKGVGIMAGILPSLAVANPVVAGAIGIAGAAGVGGTSRRAEVMHDTKGNEAVANKAGLSEAFWSGAGVALPVSLAGSLLKRIITGGGGNIIFNELDIAHQNQILKEYPQLQSPNFDLKSMTVSGILGAVTGGVFGKRGAALAKEKEPSTDIPANKDFKTIIEDSKRIIQNQIAHAEYKLKKIDEDLVDTSHASKSLEELNNYTKLKQEEIKQLQNEIASLENSLVKADSLLAGRTSNETVTPGLPSSTPPRLEGDNVHPEQTTQAETLNVEGQPTRQVEVLQDPTIEKGLETGVPRKEDPMSPAPEETTSTAPEETGTSADSAANIPGNRPRGIIIRGGTEAVTEMVYNFALRLGLGKEDIDIDLSYTEMGQYSAGYMTVDNNNVSIIKVRALEAINRELNNKRVRHWIKKATPEQEAQFRQLWIAGHELGHVLLTKLFQNLLFSDSLELGKLMKEFDAWKAKKDGMEQIRHAGNLYARASDPDYFTIFPEFFAQRVARELTMGSSSMKGPIGRFVKNMRAFWKKANALLGKKLKAKNPALGNPFDTNFVDRFIVGIIKQNEAILKATGETLFEMHSINGGKFNNTQVSTAYDWHYKAFKDPSYQIRNALDDIDFEGPPKLAIALSNIEDAETVLKNQEAVPDINEDLINELLREASEADIKSKADIEAAIPEPRPKGLVINGGSNYIRSVVTDWVNRLGLNKEDIDINLDFPMRPGITGSAGVWDDGISELRVKGARWLERFLKNPLFEHELYGMSPAQAAQFIEAWTAAHELGHILFAKLLQNDLFISGRKRMFNTGEGSLGVKKLLDEYYEWKKKTGKEEQRKVANLFAKPYASPDYYLDFPEFFSQRVARELMMGKSSKAGPISSFVNTIRSFMKDALKGLGLTKAKEKHFVDDFIINIIAANKESVATLGKTIFEIESTSTSLSDAWKWQNKHLYAKEKSSDAPAGIEGNIMSPDFVGPPTVLAIALRHIKDAETVLKEQEAVPDINPVGTGTGFSFLNKVLVKGTSLLFGIQQKGQIFSRSPMVRYVTDVILNSIQVQTQRSMELLTGVTDRSAWDGTRRTLWTSLQKVKNASSFAVIAVKSSNEDFHAVHQLFELGIGRYDYAENLRKNGATLTESQRILYNSLAQLYGRMRDMSKKTAERLGKKNILPNMPGWYPAMRKGEFIVNFRINGLNRIAGRSPTGEALMTDLVHSQSFRTKGEAQAFLDHFEKQSPEFKGMLQHNGVEKLEPSDMPNSLAEFHRAYQETRAKLQSELDKGYLPEYLKEELKNAGGNIQKVLDARMQKMVDMYIARGGTLGAHHRLRTNVSGAMGSEMFTTTHDAGKAFRDANFKAVEEFTGLMQKMDIQEKIDLILSKPEFEKTHPNTLEVVKLMQEYSLNRTKSPLAFTGLKASVDAVWEQLWSKTPLHKMKILGARKFHDAPVADLALGKAGHFFYIHALMSRPVFWASQGVQFLWSGRTMVKDGIGPVGAMTAAGRGFWSVVHPNKEFLEALFEVSQTSHTFSPQFISDLTKFGITDFLQEGGKGKLLFELVTGEKMSTAADTFSRLMTFGMMFEHYKAKGLSGSELAHAAGRATDENMVHYGRQFKAPVFQKAGVVGDLVSPLQTFSQAALGNLIADIGDIVAAPGGRAKLKASLPFMATMAITSLMAGVIGAPLVAEYETLRLLINTLSRKVGGGDLLPSAVDLVLSGDNTFSNRVMSHGLLSASTMPLTGGEGVDIAASNRWQPIFSGVITGEKTFMEAMPILKFTLDRLEDAGTLAQYKVGITELSKAEHRTAAMGITPGMYKGLLDDWKFDAANREMVPTNKGDAFVPQTAIERLAKYLGTSTINSSVERLRQRRSKEEDMRIQEKVDKQIELIADEVLAGDYAAVQKRARKLAEEYKIEGSEIVRRIENEAFRRKVPSGMRQFASKSGSMTNSQERKYVRYEDTYGNPYENQQ